MRKVVAPVNSSPAHSARWTGAAPRQAGQDREVQVHPAVLGDVESGLRQQRAVGDDRAAVRGAASRSCVLEVGVLGWLGLEHRDAELLGELGDRRGDQPAAPALRGVGTGDDADELVAAVGDGAQATAARPPGCRRRRPASESPRPAGGVRADLDGGRRRRTTPTPGSPASRACGSRRRAARRRGCRRGGRSRAGSRGPAARSPRSSPARRACRTRGRRRCSARRAVEDEVGDRQAALLAVLGLLGQREVGVHQVADLAVDVPGEDAQPDADLRRREARPGASSIVSVRSWTSLRSSASKSTTGAGGRAQHRVAEQPDRLDAHGRVLSSGRAAAQVYGA